MNTTDLFPIHEVPKMRWASDTELALCYSIGDAYDHTMRLSGLCRKQIATQTGIAIETLSAICSGRRNLPALKRARFFEVCQNAFVLQWELFQLGKVVWDKGLSIEEKAARYDLLAGRIA